MPLATRTCCLKPTGKCRRQRNTRASDTIARASSRRDALIAAPILSAAIASTAKAETIANIESMIEQTKSDIETNPDKAEVLREQQTFLENELRKTKDNADWVSAASKQVSSGSSRFLQHAVIEVPDLDKEVEFFEKALLMRTLRTRRDESNGRRTVFVGYGPESLVKDDGGNFSFELVEKLNAEEAAQFGNKIAYLQIRSPVALRVSQIIDTGGELEYGFGYLDMKSPGGVPVRAYVGKRREPFELIAINSSNIKNESKFYGDTLGLKGARLSSNFNAYMPKLAKGSRLFAFNGDFENAASILLQPVGRKETLRTGNMLKRIAILVNDTEGAAGTIGEGGKTEFVGQIPGVGTKVAAFQGFDGVGFVFVDQTDFEKELE